MQGFCYIKPKENVHSSITCLKSFVVPGCNKLSIMTNCDDVIEVLNDTPYKYRKELVEMVLKL